jgi:hypothetical protein
MPTSFVNREVHINDASELDLIETVIAVLAEGRSVELPAVGYSMFPTLKPGDKVMIIPILKNEIPESGNIVVFRNNDMLIMHRLIKILQDEPEKDNFIARGDSMAECDKTIPAQQLIGVAVSYKRGGKEQKLKVILPCKIKYKFNRFVLWFFFKMKKFKPYF